MMGEGVYYSRSYRLGGGDKEEPGLSYHDQSREIQAHRLTHHISLRFPRPVEGEVDHLAVHRKRSLLLTPFRTVPAYTVNIHLFRDAINVRMEIRSRVAHHYMLSSVCLRLHAQGIVNWTAGMQAGDMKRENEGDSGRRDGEDRTIACQQRGNSTVSSRYPWEL